MSIGLSDQKILREVYRIYETLSKSMYAKDRVNASGRFFNTPAEKLRLFDQNCQGWQWIHAAATFCVHAQNSPSTVVHGCTTVEDGSNGLTDSIFPRFISTLPDAFTHLLEKCAKF